VNASDILRSAKTVLLVDYPSREVPDTLARAGHAVFAHGGPGPRDYLAYDVEGERIKERWIGQPPRHADLVYVYRPVEELPAIVRDARRVGATAVWCETGSDGARQIVEGAGLVYVDEPSIVNVARTEH
jgi:predicted CoA-binding protein